MTEIIAKDPLADDYFGALMSETVEHLAAGEVSDAADGLEQIARHMAKAGLKIQNFLLMRAHLVDSARQKAGCPVFVLETLRAAEEKRREQRNSHSINNITTH